MPNKMPDDKIKDYPMEIALYNNKQNERSWVKADITKTYKQGDEYKKTRSFDRDDILKLSALIPTALARMQEMEQENFQKERSNLNKVKDRAMARREQRSQHVGQNHGQGI